MAKIGEYLDLLDYKGSSKHHAHPQNETFIETFKSKCKRIDLPMRLTFSSGIELTEALPSNVRGWTEDILGRFVGVWDETMFFQRFSKGCLFVYGTIGKDRCSVELNEPLDFLARTEWTEILNHARLERRNPIRRKTHLPKFRKMF
jgi:hypothetical protein